MWSRVEYSPPAVVRPLNLDLMCFLGHFFDFICNLIIHFGTFFIKKKMKILKTDLIILLEKKVSQQENLFWNFFHEKYGFWDPPQVCENECFCFQKKKQKKIQKSQNGISPCNNWIFFSGVYIFFFVNIPYNFIEFFYGIHVFKSKI